MNRVRRLDDRLRRHLVDLLMGKAVDRVRSLLMSKVIELRRPVTGRVRRLGVHGAIVHRIAEVAPLGRS